MSKSILVVYGTRSGSTGGVAKFIGDTLIESGAQVTVASVDIVENVDAYDAVFIGSPIISGKCTSEIRSFVSFNNLYLSNKIVAIFTTCLRLGQDIRDRVSDISVFVDPSFGNPKHKNEMSFLEKSHLITTYLKEISEMATDIEPVSIAFFKGVLDYRPIGLFWTLFFKFTGSLDGLKPGDYRNWEAIRSWTEQTYLSF